VKLSSDNPGSVVFSKSARACAIVFALCCVSSTADAQQFSLYLMCKGQIEAKGKSKAAHLDLALRDNNQTALVQRSNVLPVGERLKYDVSPAHYSMKMLFAGRTAAFYDWWRGTLIVWAPHLDRLHEVRVSVDRQSAALEGELLDGRGAALGKLQMVCEPKTNDDIEKPKF
jgi:hypothetical protein